jgi:hypothetical protein
MMRTHLCFILLTACLGLSSCSKGANATDKGEAGKAGSAQTSSGVSSSGSVDTQSAETTAKSFAQGGDSVKIAREDQRRVGITIAPV